MSKKTFEIEWRDDYGEEWLNKHNLEACLFTDTHITNVQVDVRDISYINEKDWIKGYKEWEKNKSEK